MRPTRTFKRYPTFALMIVSASMLLLLEACAEMNTPTPAPAGPSVTAPAPTATLPVVTTAAPGKTAAQVAAPPIVVTVTPLAATVPPTPTTVPAPTATAQPPTTRPLPTATRVPATKTVARTNVPTPAKADSKADGVGVSILAVNGGQLGKEASVTIQTSPLVACGIVYMTPSKQQSAAKGLEKKTSDANGRITWKWTIGQNTKPGKGSVSVTCGDATGTAPINIG